MENAELNEPADDEETEVYRPFNPLRFWLWRPELRKKESKPLRNTAVAIKAEPTSIKALDSDTELRKDMF